MRHRAGALMALGLLVGGGLSGGCGYSQGALLYMLGVGKRPMVDAKFELGDGPILILVDDPAGRVDWLPAIRYLTDELGQELIKREATGKVIPRETLDRVRRRHVEYGKLTCREIGELTKAQQVLWLEVKEFFAEEVFLEPKNAAYFAVSVKVINPAEKKDRRRVRLWPKSPRGYFATLSLDGITVARAKTKDAIARELAKALAVDIARLFSEYRPGDFEREK